MGKVKSWWMDQQEMMDYDESLYDYHMMCHIEQLIKDGVQAYQMTSEEEKAYNQYMEGQKCLGQQQKDAHTANDSNLKRGQSQPGERNIPKLRSPRLRK